MTEAEKAYQYFVIAVPENEEQAKAYFWARKALQSTLTPPNEPERAGLYGKYTVYKNKDGSLVTDCFILRPAKDPAAVAALRAYAAATDNAELAADIINWVGAEANERVKVMEAINNAAVAYIEGGPYENDLPGMELALKIDRLSRDFVRPPEGEADA